ncbi:hypothetical protein CEE37_03660 [candidate division LCP-89 bacterium B3_LCP]|uniref:Haloacid dehalogenase n=1 Tax=candidate division LCP-89 bacterium B3_LCP TaxID=2012998 RepID=A0A532V3B3_UNCL8|nr:MAG: hypothetical protein CEE37_03660 [candidate division LCP-89 bacterium B3_LCP]
MTKIQALLFDLDNTLVDFMKMKHASVDAAVIAMIDAGLDLSADEADKRIWKIYRDEGIEFQEVFDLLLIEHYGQIDFKLFASAVIAYRRAREDALVLYPHVKSTLVELVRRGYRLAVISDAPAKQAWLRLCSLGLQHIFETVITFEDTGEHKPHPLPFQKALQTLDVSADEALMIGDWPERDMAGANALGIRTIYARYGDTHGTIHSDADWEVDDISEILEILKNVESD